MISESIVSSMETLANRLPQYSSCVFDLTDVLGSDDYVGLDILMYTAHVRGITLIMAKCHTHGVETVSCREKSI